MSDQLPSETPTPRLDRKDWQDNYIPSDSRHMYWILWGIAAMWHVFTVPLYFQFDQIWRQAQADPLVLLAAIFPLVGIGMVAAAIHSTRTRNRFGDTYLVLDPFPGSLGGQVGGVVDTSIPFDPSRRFSISLRCIRSYVSGSGKNRSRKESICWTTDGTCHSELDGGATRLRFRFDVPAGQPGSDLEKANDYILWRVQISCDMDGPDFERRWTIPVLNTGAVRSSIARGTEAHPDTFDVAMDGIESVADIRFVAGGIEAWYPPFQRPAQGIFALVFGLVFLAIGVGVGLSGDAWVIPIAFTLVGGLIGFYGLYYLGKGLMVSVTRHGIKSRRFLYGYRFPTQAITAESLRKLEIKQGATMQSGNRTTVFYQILAHRKEGAGKPIVVGERLTGRAEAELLRDTYLSYLAI
jgi:hypothetical protein